MSTNPTNRFELHGRFAGFFRDMFGKRRMVVQVGEEELYLKIPKELRHELDGRLWPGQMVTVSGGEDEDTRSGRSPRTVTRVVAAGEKECFACPIRVCAKKHCWRNGGREIFQELERRIEEEGLGDSIRLKAVGCMDECDHGPNVEAGGRDFRRCTSRDVERILRQVSCPGDPRERQEIQLGALAADATDQG